MEETNCVMATYGESKLGNGNAHGNGKSHKKHMEKANWIMEKHIEKNNGKADRMMRNKHKKIRN